MMKNINKYIMSLCIAMIGFSFSSELTDQLRSLYSAIPAGNQEADRVRAELARIGSLPDIQSILPELIVLRQSVRDQQLLAGLDGAIESQKQNQDTLLAQIESMNAQMAQMQENLRQAIEDAPRQYRRNMAFNVLNCASGLSLAAGFVFSGYGSVDPRIVISGAAALLAHHARNCVPNRLLHIYNTCIGMPVGASIAYSYHSGNPAPAVTVLAMFTALAAYLRK